MKPLPHVIILCQGQQTRLPGLDIPKQLLPLPECGGVPILHRTIRQLARWIPGVIRGQGWMTVVGKRDHFAKLLVDVDASLPSGSADVELVELAQPGNSSLIGLRRYLEQHNRPHTGDVVVLLGDVVYSWRCLDAIFTPTPGPISFVASSDLSPSTGELWGIRWDVGYSPLYSLDRALEHYPPFVDYQPGQMRRWLWACQVLGHASVVRCDDYTRDFDKPEDLKLLDVTSENAKADDLRMGMVWT